MYSLHSQIVKVYFKPITEIKALFNVKILGNKGFKMKETDDKSLTNLVSDLLIHLDNEIDREGLEKTPHRYAKAMCFLTSGKDLDAHKIAEAALFENKNFGLIEIRDIEFFSICEHHLLPFHGTMSITYQPDKKIIGLSKVARVVNVYARRLQVQERLTKQVAETLFDVLKPKGIIVEASACHFCMMMRGVQKQNSVTVTTHKIGKID